MKAKHIIFISFLLTVSSATCAHPSRTTMEEQTTNDSVAIDTIAQVIQMANEGNAIAQNRLGYWYYVGYGTIKQDYSEAFNWWSKAAAQNNPDALGNLGLCYQTGHGVTADSLKAVNCYEEAVKKGNKTVIPSHDKLAREQKSAFSALLMRDIYAKAIGVKRDTAKAEEYLKLAAESGNVESQFSYALSQYNNKQFNESAKWFRTAAKAGHSTAAYLYGMQLLQGNGVAQDRAKGLEFIRKAAKDGKYMANYELGRIYLEGDGVEKDARKAVGYLREAAPFYKKAAGLLANCYMNGTGTAKDYYFASQWLAESIDDGRESRSQTEQLLSDPENVAFVNYLRGLYRYFNDKKYDEALGFFKKVEKAKVIDGSVMSAMCLANPKYDKQNAKKAAKMLEKAAATSSIANYYLSSLYETGTGVEKNDAKAVELLKKAADQDIAYAQCKLADRYMAGKGVEKDLTKAAKLYLQAEQLHHLTPSSAKNLAKLYEQQVNVLPDLDKAADRIKALNALKENISLSLLLARVPMQ